jgi:hypothetical protein
MQLKQIPLVLVGTGLLVFSSRAITTTLASDGGARIALEDQCDPTDPAWAPTGGCALKNGTVRLAEFNAFLFSSFIPANLAAPRVPVGHPAWRLNPGYLVIESDDHLRVTNAGGRGHTFTEVAEFGGGFVPPLNGGVPPGIAEAPECAAARTDPNAVLAPGTTARVGALSLGEHRFQCCIHPWMRAEVKVVADNDR